MTRLCYRGITYEKRIFTLKVSPKKTLGKYRGLAYYPNCFKVSQNCSLKLQIKYRGATYV